MLYYLGITFEFTATECSSGGYKARGKKYKSINIYIYIFRVNIYRGKSKKMKK